MDPAAVFASLRALGGSPPYTVVIGCEAGSVEEGIALPSPSLTPFRGPRERSRRSWRHWRTPSAAMPMREEC